MQDPYLPDGWTQEKIDETLDWQYQNRMFCCSQGCGWVQGECQHRNYEGKLNENSKKL